MTATAADVSVHMLTLHIVSQVDFGQGPPLFNLGLPTWPFNVSTVVSKSPQGSLVQLMLDGDRTPTSAATAMLTSIAPEAHFV